MEKKRIITGAVFLSAAALTCAAVMLLRDRSHPAQKQQTLEDYLAQDGIEWFLTGKKQYLIQAKTVSQTVSFRNELEAADYTVTDDGKTAVLKGTQGEMWAAPVEKVCRTYTRPDGTALTAADFAEKDRWIDIMTIPSANSNYAMQIPANITVTVQTAWGDVLHANLPEMPHGAGDYLVCRAGTDGKPDLSDVWIVSGVLFPDCYDL